MALKAIVAGSNLEAIALCSITDAGDHSGNIEKPDTIKIVCFDHRNKPVRLWGDSGEMDTNRAVTPYKYAMSPTRSGMHAAVRKILATNPPAINKCR